MNIVTKMSFHFHPLVSLCLRPRKICVIRGLQTTYVLRKHAIKHSTTVKESLQIGPIMQNKPNLHFTAENAGCAERKDICVSDCPIKKYALYPFSPRSLRPLRLMRNAGSDNDFDYFFAKQTQFPGCSNERNLNPNNQLPFTIYQLPICKTNPKQSQFPTSLKPT
jgi:hypothetical protein